MPNIGGELRKVDDVLSIDPSLKELAQQGNQTFEDIPLTVENKTKVTENEINNQTDKYQAEVEEHVTNVNKTAYEVLDDDLSLQQIRSHIRDGAEKAVEFDKYRWVYWNAIMVDILSFPSDLSLYVFFINLCDCSSGSCSDLSIY